MAVSSGTYQEQRSIRFNIPKSGWNTDSPRRELSTDFSPDMTNIFYENINEARRRPCQSAHIVAAPDGTAVDHIFEHKGITGIAKLFVHTAGGNIYEDVAGVWTLADATFTGRIRTSMMGNLLIVGDGVNPAKKFNGTTWSVITTAPAAPFSSYIGNIFHTHKGRMYAAGDPARNMDVIHSDTIGGTGLGADYWSTVLSGGGSQGGFIDTTADLAAGDTITGITTHLGRLVVFFNNHIIFYATSEGTAGLEADVFKLVSGEGCISHDSIQGIGDDVLFLSPTGYKSLQQVLVQGDSGVKSASIPINAHVTTLLQTIVVADIRSTYVPKFGTYICYMGAEQHVYQTQLKVWQKWAGLPRCLFTDSAGVAYVAGTTVQQLDTTVFGDTIGAAAEVAVSMSMDFASLRVSQTEIKPRWNRAEVIGECDPDEPIIFSYYPDNETAAAISETVVLNAGGTVRGPVDLRIPIVGRSEMLGMRVTNDNITDFRLTAMEAYFLAGGLR